MNILITGASGLLGRELVKWLSQENNIFAIARDNSNNNFESSKNITVINMDLTNIDTELLPKPSLACASDALNIACSVQVEPDRTKIYAAPAADNGSPAPPSSNLEPTIA